MIDYDILKQFGTTNDRIREVFTAAMPSPRRQRKMTEAEVKAVEKDIKCRQRWEEKIANWINESVVFSLKNHKLYSAVDLAWDAMPINKQIIPLMQYATGRIDMGKAITSLKGVPDGSNYIRKNAKGEEYIDLPKFTEVNINLIRSVITRRVAAQATKYNALYPHFKYEARDRTQLGKLKAEMTSERMDIMADQFDYKHFQTQLTRDMFLYGSAVAFPRCSWEKEVQIVRADVAKEFEVAGKIKTKDIVVKEGVCWTNPHPSRTFCDNAYAPATLNQDIGCEYAGFWDVCKFGDIANNSAYFNRQNINFSANSISWFAAYSTYFNQYYDTVTPPQNAPIGDMSADNDRKNNIGRYAVGMEGVSTFFTHLCVKVNPRDEGWGDYPHPVWVLLKVAGDSTVVYADILPSSPAAYFGFNQNDGRQVNISVAHELMPFQDQITNLFSQLLETVKADMFSVAVLNTDVFPDTEEGRKVKADFEAALSGKNYYASMQVLAASFDKLRSLGINVTADNIFKVVRSSPNTAITAIFQMIAQTLGMADRLQVMSAHEQGQAAPHEISATESNQIAGSTDTIYSFISDSLDEGRAAMKRICFESTLACGSDEVKVSVTKRYPASLLERAGFKLTSSGDDGEGQYGYHVVMGSKAHLNHDYIFTARDGGNRPSNSAAASVLVQMMQAIGSFHPALQNAIFTSMGKEKLFELINTIWRLSDAGVDMQLEVKPGDDDALLVEDDQQVMQLIGRLSQAVEQISGDNAQIKQVLSQIVGAPQQQQTPPR